MTTNKNEEEENIDKENQEFDELDDNFGLPDIDYEPLEEVINEADKIVEEKEEFGFASDSAEQTSFAEPFAGQAPKKEYIAGTYTPKDYQESSSAGKAKGVIITLVIVLAVLAGAWYWFMYKPEQEAKEKARQEQIAKERARQAQIAKEAAAAKKKTDYDNLIEKADIEFGEERWDAAQSSYSGALSLYSREQYPQDQMILVNEKLAAIAAKSVPGSIEKITSATGRFYIVVSSSIEGDLAMDYGNKMAAEGTSVKIIEPYGNIRFYRVSLGDYDAWDQAVTASASFRTTYGNVIWILKY